VPEGIVTDKREEQEPNQVQEEIENDVLASGRAREVGLGRHPGSSEEEVVEHHTATGITLAVFFERVL
jgi:hypothetical protein